MHVVILYFFVCVQFIFHFVLLALNFARLGALQYLLGYASTCKVCVCKSTCYYFFHKDKTTAHLPMICSNPWATAKFKAESQQSLAV